MKIIELLSNNPKLTITELSTSLKMSVSGVRYQIGKLKNRVFWSVLVLTRVAIGG